MQEGEGEVRLRRIGPERSLRVLLSSQAARSAPTSIEEVTIRPLPPKPSLFIEAVEEQRAPLAQSAPEKPFIPPQAERPVVRPPRMPRVDELPMPAQNQIRARQGE